MDYHWKYLSIPLKTLNDYNQEDSQDSWGYFKEKDFRNNVVYEPPPSPPHPLEYTHSAWGGRIRTMEPVGLWSQLGLWELGLLGLWSQLGLWELGLLVRTQHKDKNERQYWARANLIIRAIHITDGSLQRFIWKKYHLSDDHIESIDTLQGSSPVSFSTWGAFYLLRTSPQHRDYFRRCPILGRRGHPLPIRAPHGAPQGIMFLDLRAPLPYPL